MEEARKLIEKNDEDLKKREDELIQKVNTAYAEAIKRAVVEFKYLEQRASWKPRLDALDKFQKADVQPFTRVRRGRMERVMGYARAGARKAIMVGLIAVMATAFAVSPLMAQTKYTGGGKKDAPVTAIVDESEKMTLQDRYVDSPARPVSETQQKIDETTGMYKNQMQDVKTQMEINEQKRAKVIRDYKTMNEELESHRYRYRTKLQNLKEQLERHGGPGTAGASTAKDALKDLDNLRSEFEKEQRAIRNYYGY